MPLQAATSPAHYRDPDVFEQERTGLFARSWAFVGLANELATPNDFVRMDIAGRDVIIQNCSGTFRAFENICMHRHACIHDQAGGNRRLICPYHGWTYNDDGIPTGIPRKENFPQVTAAPGKYALKQFRVALAGHFIFVNIDSAAPDLQAFLGHGYDFLVSVSGGLEKKMDDFRGEIAANWKVVIENALEGYHVPAVHRRTLGSIRQLSAKEVDIVDHLPEGNGHSYMINKAQEEWLGKWRRFEHHLGKWAFKFDHYVHQLLFPNLTVTSFMGYSYHIQQFHPESVDRTSVHSRIYSVRCEGQTEKGASIMKSVYDEGLDFTRRVFDEDRRICELVHRGLRNADNQAVLANHLEIRIAHFQAAYMKAMQGS